jgi:hypothetical protein
VVPLVIFAVGGVQICSISLPGFFTDVIFLSGTVRVEPRV